MVSNKGFGFLYVTGFPFKEYILGVSLSKSHTCVLIAKGICFVVRSAKCLDSDGRQVPEEDKCSLYFLNSLISLSRSLLLINIYK